MKLSSTNISLALAALVVLGGLYWFFFAGTGAPTDELPFSAPSMPPLESRFLELTNQLDPITFKTDIFVNPRFAALVDITTEIVAEASGRTDPFAPVGK
ncbi:MAG TPA: hypothetical protein VM103_00190 [Candidatus Paceibacterota bacterium]|nr:hypothetical protein [Candidatus Paceibacterota bacterium]